MLSLLFVVVLLMYVMLIVVMSLLHVIVNPLFWCVREYSIDVGLCGIFLLCHTVLSLFCL